MYRAMARLAAVTGLIATVIVTGAGAAHADGVLGLNGPTGEPLPWTLAAVVGVAGVAFVVRAVLRLSRRPAPAEAQPATEPAIRQREAALR